MIDPASLDWAKMDGLIPAIVQVEGSGEVRMLGYMNRTALEATIATGLVTFFSRSRGELWVKGETSGHSLEVKQVLADCDDDALLILATARGPTCHTGANSCFGAAAAPRFAALNALAEVITDRAATDPAESYTARLVAEGPRRLAQKVGEEGVEVAIAAVAGDDGELTSEAADLVYHLSVLLEASGSSWDAVLVELARRHARSKATAAS